MIQNAKIGVLINILQLDLLDGLDISFWTWDIVIRSHRPIHTGWSLINSIEDVGKVHLAILTSCHLALQLGHVVML